MRRLTVFDPRVLYCANTDATAGNKLKVGYMSINIFES